MRSPTTRYNWLELDEVTSTQAVAAEQLKSGGEVGIVLARHQTDGRGRFDRTWLSERDESLTMSLIFRDYADHKEPHLVGMNLALAAAGALHCQLRWPNDLCLHGRKLGGILTEIVADPKGRSVPIVGIGINLNQLTFPSEIADRATSLAIAHGGTYDPVAVAREIVDRLAHLPEPDHWTDLASIWSIFDDTPGKHYSLLDGTDALALGVGSRGELLCSVGGESRSILAADAFFG